MGLYNRLDSKKAKEFFNTFETPYLKKIEDVKQNFNLNAVPKDGIAIKFLGHVDEDSVKKFADSIDGIICKDNIVVINSDPFVFNIYEDKFYLDSWGENNSDNEELIAITKELFSDFRLIKNGIDNIVFMASEEVDGFYSEETFLDNKIFIGDNLSSYGEVDSSYIANPNEWFTTGEKFIFGKLKKGDE